MIIRITKETFNEFSEEAGRPIRTFFRQVGDGPVLFYTLGEDGVIRADEAFPTPDTPGARAMASARATAQVTGSVEAHYVNGSHGWAHVWVRPGSSADIPVVTGESSLALALRRGREA